MVAHVWNVRDSARFFHGLNSAQALDMGVATGHVGGGTFCPISESSFPLPQPGLLP